MNFVASLLVADGDALCIDAGALRVRLPEDFRARLAPYVGREVVFGVRPEDITTAAADSENTLAARADVVETLGSEIFVYLSCGAHSIVARMEMPEQPLRVGQDLKVQFKVSKTHVFDKDSLQAIV